MMRTSEDEYDLAVTSKEACCGVQVFCRVGRVKRYTTKRFELRVDAYDVSRTIPLYEGREICVSYRAGLTNEFIKKKSFIRATIREADVPGMGRTWSAFLGPADAFAKTRTTSLSVPGVVSVSVLIGMHRYDHLPPIASRCGETTVSSYAVRARGTDGSGTARFGPDEEQDAFELRRVRMVDDHSSPVPQFVPSDDATSSENDRLVWYERVKRDASISRGPYKSYADFLHNRLSIYK